MDLDEDSAVVLSFRPELNDLVSMSLERMWLVRPWLYRRAVMLLILSVVAWLAWSKSNGGQDRWAVIGTVVVGAVMVAGLWWTSVKERARKTFMRWPTMLEQQ